MTRGPVDPSFRIWWKGEAPAGRQAGRHAGRAVPERASARRRVAGVAGAGGGAGRGARRDKQRQQRRWPAGGGRGRPDSQSAQVMEAAAGPGTGAAADEERSGRAAARGAKIRVRRVFVKRSPLPKLKAMAQGKPVPTRYDYDGAAWFERKRSGYKGMAWYDLPAVATNKGRRRELSSDNAGGGGLRKRARFSSLAGGVHSGLPPWMSLEEREAAAGLVYERAIIELAKGELHDRHDASVDSVAVEGELTLLEAAGASEESSELTTREETVEERFEREHQERMRAITIEKRQCIRDQQRLEDRLVHGQGVDGVNAITQDAYHFPRTRAMLRAKAAVEYGQGSAVVRNWLLIKNAFDRGGGVLPLHDLRQTLVACGITLPQVTRVVFKAGQSLNTGEDLISYVDFYRQHYDVISAASKRKNALTPSENGVLLLAVKANQAENAAAAVEGYETDSDMEDLLSVCMEADHADQLVDEDCADGNDGTYEVEAKDGGHKKQKLVIENGKPRVALSAFWDDNVGVADADRYARRVLRLKRKIKTAMHVRDAKVTGDDGVDLSVDEVLDMAGNGLSFLKRIYKKWMRPKPVRKSSALIAGSVMSVTDLISDARHGNAPRLRPLDDSREQAATSKDSTTTTNNNNNNNNNNHNDDNGGGDDDDNCTPRTPLRDSLFRSPGFAALVNTGGTAMAAAARADVERLGRYDALLELGEQPSLGHCVWVAQEAAAVTCQALLRGFYIRNRARLLFQQAIAERVSRKRNKELILKWFRISWEQQRAKRFLLRPFVAWRSHMRRLRHQREYFRTTFWPFFVWRRWAGRKIRARNKAKFLKRVWAAYSMLRHLRAWRVVAEEAKEKMRVAASQFQFLAGRQLAAVFNEWRLAAAAQRRRKSLWAKPGGGAQMQQRAKRKWLARTFTCWRLSTVGSRVLRRRSIKLYNFVRGEIVHVHRENRVMLGLPPRRYELATSHSLPPLPAVPELLGPACAALIEEPGQRELREVCSDYRDHVLVPQDRLDRILTCIRRNVCGTKVFAAWRKLVEDRQKNRYAWHHHVVGATRRAFKGWKKLHLKAKRAARAGKQQPQPTGAADTGDTAVPVGTATSAEGGRALPAAEGDAESQAAAAVVAAAAEEEQARQLAADALAVRRKSVAIFKAERAASHTQWINDQAHGRKSILLATQSATALRKARLTREIHLEAHERLLRQAKDNAAMSLRATDRLLKTKARALEEEKRKQAEKAKDLHRLRGVMLHDALVKVIDEVDKVRMDELRRQCFRMIKFPVIFKRSFGVMQRKRLQNWLRICVRLRNVWRAMPKFRELRVKWGVFNQWLRFLDNRYRHESGGLREEVALRAQRMRSYSDYVLEVGEEEAEGSLKGWFCRWVEFSQKHHTRARLVALATNRKNVLLLQRVLEVWRDRLKPRHTLAKRAASVPFAARRAAFDLDKWKVRLLGSEKRLLSTQLRMRNAFVKDRNVFAVRGPGFNKEVKILKKVLDKHALAVRARLDLETRLLCSAFEERGTFSYNDKRVGCVGMSEDDADIGHKFLDPSVAASVSVHAVLVAVSEGMVVALQLKMRSGKLSAPRFTVGPAHGARQKSSNAAGAAGEASDCAGGGAANGTAAGEHQELKSRPRFEVHEFTMQGVHEKITAIEGYAMHDVMGGKLRFRTSLGRVSPWYGSGENGERFVLPRAREMSTSQGGGYRFVEEFITGFYGFDSETSILSLGILLRQVDQTNVFSRCWLDRVASLLDDVPGSEDVEDKHTFMKLQELEHQNQFNSVLAMRSADVEEALARSTRLARRMRYAGSTPQPLRRPGVVRGLMNWFFNAQSKHLVKIGSAAAADLDKASGGDGTIAKGYMMIHQGQAMMKEAAMQTKKVRALTERKGAQTPLNAAHIGTRRFSQITADLAAAKAQSIAAEKLISDGRAIVDEGLFEMPKLDTGPRASRYYEDLVRLAVIKDQLS